MVSTVYCDPADVTGLTSMSYTTASRPSSGQVSEWCVVFSAEIEAALDKSGIKVPVAQATSPQSFMLVKQYVVYAVAAVAELAAYVGQSMESSRSARFQELYDNALKAIRHGDCRRFTDAETTATFPIDRYRNAQSGNLLADPLGGSDAEKSIFSLGMKW